VCAIHDFYTLKSLQFDASRVVDAHFSYYERPLATAFGQRISGVIDAHAWLTVLVRFVAGLLVRGPDFNRRFLRRSSDPLRTELAKLAHIFYGSDKHQRLLAPICGAEWTVLETSGRVEQSTNDLGFIGFEHLEAHCRRIAVPLDPYHILTLRPRLQASLAIANAGMWVPELRFGKLSDEQQTVGTAAHRFLFGPSEPAVTPHVIKQDLPPLHPDPADLGSLRAAKPACTRCSSFNSLRF
jgi:hypothetical protein